MSGIDDLMAGSNDRWAHAIRRAQGIEDNGLGEAVNSYFTRYFPSGLFLVAVGTAVGILGLRGTLSDWPILLSFGFLVAVLGVVVGGLVYNAKKVVPAAKSGKWLCQSVLAPVGRTYLAPPGALDLFPRRTNGFTEPNWAPFRNGLWDWSWETLTATGSDLSGQLEDFPVEDRLKGVSGPPSSGKITR